MLGQGFVTCMGGDCIARGDDESREAVLLSGAIEALIQSLDFNSEVVVQQECCTALGARDLS